MTKTYYFLKFIPVTVFPPKVSDHLQFVFINKIPVPVLFPILLATIDSGISLKIGTGANPNKLNLLLLFTGTGT
jgi:hypothetical protein